MWDSFYLYRFEIHSISLIWIDETGSFFAHLCNLYSFFQTLHYFCIFDGPSFPVLLCRLFRTNHSIIIMAMLRVYGISWAFRFLNFLLKWYFGLLKHISYFTDTWCWSAIFITDSKTFLLLIMGLLNPCLTPIHRGFDYIQCGKKRTWLWKNDDHRFFNKSDAHY